MRTVSAALLLLGVLVAGSAEARTLEDILKEKGVITEADYQEVVKKKPINYTVAKGFTFTSADERFQLAIGGRMQFRYSYFDRDRASNQSSWQARRIKLYTSGHLYGKDLTYGFQADFANGGNQRILDDAWMNYRIIDAVQFKVGQFKTPFVRQEMISDGNLQFVDRSPVADSFKHGRDMGLMLNGRLLEGIVTYNYGIFGGVGQSATRSTAGNADAALVARLAVNPFGEQPLSEGDLEPLEKPYLSVAGSYVMNTVKRSETTAATVNSAGAVVAGTPTLGFVDVDGSNTSYFGRNGWFGQGNALFVGNEKIDVDTFGVDSAFKWMGFSFQGEYLQGVAHGTVSGRNLHARGFYTQAGYCLIPGKLEAALRYSFFHPNRANPRTLQNEIIGGLSYYFDKHNLKIQSDVASLHTHTLPRTDDMVYRVQAQVTF